MKYPLSVKELFPFFFDRVACHPGIWALLQPGFYTSHDGSSHLGRLAQFVIALKDGQWPPRWGGTLMGGLGYPVFIFSYQLPFLLASLPVFLGASLSFGLKFVFGVSFVLSGLGVYRWLREQVSQAAGLTGAIFFLYAPYRFILQYVRAAIGELLALALLPWLLWRLDRLIRNPNWSNAGWMALFLGLCQLSHSLFIALFGWVGLGYFLVGILFVTKHRFEVIKKAIVSVALGLGVAAFNLVPMVFERFYIVFDRIYRSQWQGHLVEWWQLIRSPWGYGYSHPGVAEDAMSFQVGLAQILVMGGLTGLLLASKLPFVQRFLMPLPKKSQWLGVLSLVWFGAAVLLMINTAFTTWLWQTIPGLSTVDIPWRFLGVTTLAASLGSALLVHSFKKAWLVAIVAIGLVLVANRNHLRINQLVIVDDRQYYHERGTTTFLNEYRPVWRRSTSVEWVSPRVMAGDMSNQVDILRSTSKLLHFKTNFAQPDFIQINIAYFPGWHVFHQKEGKWEEQWLGQEVRLVQEPVLKWKEEEVSGSMQLAVPAGEQEFKVEFFETPIRLISDWITVFSLFCVIGLMVLPGKLKWSM